MGGILGALVVAAAIFGLVFYYRRNQNLHEPPPIENEEPQKSVTYLEPQSPGLQNNNIASGRLRYPDDQITGRYEVPQAQVGGRLST